MSEISCYDKQGLPLTHLMQWDANQVLKIENFGLSEPPLFHFTMLGSDEALTVESILDSEDMITAKIPNILLQKTGKMLVYIYVIETDYGQRTMYTVELPIRERAKPADYEYVENIEFVSAEAIEVRLRDYISKLNLSPYKIKFSPASTRANIATNESLATLFGKISKTYSDLKTVAFSGKYTDLTGTLVVENNLTTTAAGHVLDARQGKILNDTITQKEKAINDTITNIMSGDITSADIDKMFDE